MSDAAPPEGPTVYDAVGGQPFFDELVDRFYQGVEADPVLRPMYPDDDMDGARYRLAGFLAQYWGGPPRYSEERGHPRLRMRHNPFTIGQTERDHWLAHMRDAVERTLAARDLPGEIEQQMLSYFEMAASAMVNSPFRFAGPGPANA